MLKCTISDSRLGNVNFQIPYFFVKLLYVWYLKSVHLLVDVSSLTFYSFPFSFFFFFSLNQCLNYV